MAPVADPLMGLVTLTFDLETGTRVASQVGNLRVLQLFAMYATDGRTDGRQNQRLMMKFIRLPGA